jgi:hypothetical protein
MSRRDIHRANMPPVLSVHPQEWREKWFQMIPGGRLCDPAELKGVSWSCLKYHELISTNMKP